MKKLFNLFCQGFCAAALIGEPSPALFAYVLGEVIA